MTVHADRANFNMGKINTTPDNLDNLINEFSKIEADLRIAKEKNTEINKNTSFNKFDK